MAIDRHRQHPKLRWQQATRARATTFDEVLDRCLALHQAMYIFFEHCTVQGIALKATTHKERPTTA